MVVEYHLSLDLIIGYCPFFVPELPLGVFGLSWQVHEVVAKSGSFQGARRVCEKLQQSGHEAFCVGGSVRDLLLSPQRIPNDFDIATSASPDAVRDIFPAVSFVGKAFGVSLVRCKGHSFEVATFRREANYADHRRPSLVEFGTREEDSARRDFTVNAIYLDPVVGSLFDPHGGIEDLASKTLRAVGVARERFREDALRVIRLFRFYANLHDFCMDTETLVAAKQEASGLRWLSRERILQECTKVKSGCFFRFVSGVLSSVSAREICPSFPDLTGWPAEPWELVAEDFHRSYPLTAFHLATWWAHPKENARALAQGLLQWPAARIDLEMLEFELVLEDLMFVSTARGDDIWDVARLIFRRLQRIKVALCVDVAFVVWIVGRCGRRGEGGRELGEHLFCSLRAAGLSCVVADWLVTSCGDFPRRSAEAIEAFVVANGWSKRGIGLWREYEDAWLLMRSLGLVNDGASLVSEALLVERVRQRLGG